MILTSALVGCSPGGEGDTGSLNVNDAVFFGEEVSADGKSTTKTYYVYNPTSGGCSSALKLTATGTSLTQITPSGCVISCTACGTAPTWNSLTSTGASTLSDTWYDRSNRFDKDYTSATTAAWCDSYDPVKVKVTGSSVTRLQYYFTDNTTCWF